MSDNQTTELREKLREHGIEYAESQDRFRTRFRFNYCEACGDYLNEIEVMGACITASKSYLTPEQAIAVTLGEQRSTVEIAELLDEFEHECYMLRVEASETRAKDDVVRESYERIRDEFAGRIAAAVGSESNPDGLPAGLTISDDSTLLNWRGENYVKQSALGNGTLTAEQVLEAIEKRFDFDVWVPAERWQAIADELNAELGSGTCELDYDHHCSNCGVCVHERAVLVRKKLDGGLWTVVSKPASFCPNCGRRVKR